MRWLAVAGVVGASVGGSLTIAHLTGAIRAPSNDDWLYSRDALEWFGTGELRLLGYEGASLVGHLAWGLGFMDLFGPSIAVLRWATATAAAIGLIALFVVFERIVGGRTVVFATAAVAAFPTYPLLAATYMTDSTGFAAQMVCLAVGLAALAAGPGRREALIGVALAFGLAGFTVREFAAAAIVAVLGGYAAALRAEGRRLRPALWASGICALLLGAFIVWRRSLPHSWVPSASLHPLDLVVNLGESYFTLALSLLPILVVAAPGRWGVGRRPRAAFAVTGAVIAVALLCLAYEWRSNLDLNLLLGNYVTPAGALDDGVLLGHRPRLFGPITWSLVTLAALGSGVVLALLAAAWTVRRPRPSEVLIIVYALASAAVLVTRVVTGLLPFDRYLWTLTVPVAAILLARGPSAAPAARAGGWGVIAAFAALSVLLAWNVGSYTTARWAAGASSSGPGVGARNVDAGYEWVGWHYRGRLRDPQPPVAAPPRPWYLANLLNAAGNCVIVASSRLPHPWLVPVERREYRWLAGLGRAHLWVYLNPRGCRAAGAKPARTRRPPIVPEAGRVSYGVAERDRSGAGGEGRTRQ